jgi:hypothetical protein
VSKEGAIFETVVTSHTGVVVDLKPEMAWRAGEFVSIPIFDAQAACANYLAGFVNQQGDLLIQSTLHREFVIWEV